MGVSRRDDIDGVTRSIWSHIGYRVHVINIEVMRGGFGKSRLAEMNGNVTIGEAFPSKCRAKELVNIAHEVNFDIGCQFFTE